VDIVFVVALVIGGILLAVGLGVFGPIHFRKRKNRKNK
jgi:hypothetical protein